ncbi:shugoshin 2 [Discoglossus pictus]
MDLSFPAPLVPLHTMKERMREKINGPLKSVKISSSLAAKIKSKALNNSSFMKISLKNNNKALALALTFEKEKTRKLENDQMFLHKEVKMLHFQNALLRQNLNIVNKTLKDIDLYMNINLSTAIEISGMESSDILIDEPIQNEQIVRHSVVSCNEDQGFRCTGMPLRVPCSSAGDPAPDSLGENQESHLPARLSSNFNMSREKSGGVENTRTDTTIVISRVSERMNDSISQKKSSDYPGCVDESSISNGHTSDFGAFVTRRKKRLTMSSSSSHSMKLNSDESQRRSSVNQESGTNLPWELYALGTDNAVQFDSVGTPVSSEIAGHSDRNSHMSGVSKKRNKSTMPCSSIESTQTVSNQNQCVVSMESMSSAPWDQDDVPMQQMLGQSRISSEVDTPCVRNSLCGLMASKDKRSIVSCSSGQSMETSCNQNQSSVIESNTMAPSKQNAENVAESNLIKPEERRGHPIEDGSASLQHTLYDADMDLTASDSGSIVAVSSKSKTGKGKNKSDIPVKHGGSSLRKVKNSGKEKNKKSLKKGSKTGDERKDHAKTKRKSNILNNPAAEQNSENIQQHDSTLATERDLNTGTQITDKDLRRTYVVGVSLPVNQEKVDDFDLTTAMDTVSECAVLQNQFEIEEAPVTGFDVDEQLPSHNMLLLPNKKMKLSSELKKKQAKTEKIKKSKLKDFESSKKKVHKQKRSSKQTDKLAVENEEYNVGISHDQSVDHGKTDVISRDVLETMVSRKTDIRRGTYVVHPPETRNQKDSVESASVEDSICYRRKTFVIPKPISLASNMDQTFDIVKETDNIETEAYGHSLTSLGSPSSSQRKTGACVKEQNKSEKEKLKTNQVDENDDTCSNDSETLSNKVTSLLSEDDKKRKTYAIPAKKDSKVTLVRESLVHPLSKCKNPTKATTDYLANEQDSFMLDMVSESILDSMVEFPSFDEFPSAANMENLSFSTDKTLLNSIPILELPVSEDYNVRESSQPPKSLNVLDENDYSQPQDGDEEEDADVSESLTQSMESQGPNSTAFQDLTNTTSGYIKQSPKVYKEDGGDSPSSSRRRRRNPVCYKEPNLHIKLRRGDNFTNTKFLHSPIIKGKRKRSSKKQTSQKSS